jgi:hypothetical protein
MLDLLGTGDSLEPDYALSPIQSIESVRAVTDRVKTVMRKIVNIYRENVVADWFSVNLMKMMEDDIWPHVKNLSWNHDHRLIDRLEMACWSLQRQRSLPTRSSSWVREEPMTILQKMNQYLYRLMEMVLFNYRHPLFERSWANSLPVKSVPRKQNSLPHEFFFSLLKKYVQYNAVEQWERWKTIPDQWPSSSGSTRFTLKFLVLKISCIHWMGTHFGNRQEASSRSPWHSRWYLYDWSLHCLFSPV